MRNSWCSVHQKADLGIDEPEFYTENGSMYVSGNCVIAVTNVCILNRRDIGFPETTDKQQLFRQEKIE